MHVAFIQVPPARPGPQFHRSEPWCGSSAFGEVRADFTLLDDPVSHQRISAVRRRARIERCASELAEDFGRTVQGRCSRSRRTPADPHGSIHFWLSASKNRQPLPAPEIATSQDTLGVHDRLRRLNTFSVSALLVSGSNGRRKCDEAAYRVPRAVTPFREPVLRQYLIAGVAG